MKFKIVPPVPASLDQLRNVHQAIPLVPDNEESCCTRLMRDAGIPAQDEAKEWLTFCRALELAEQGPQGFSRIRNTFDPERLSVAFCERVYATDEVLTVLEDADESVTVETVVDHLPSHWPVWERERSAGWVERWSVHIERILEWAVLFGLAERDGDRYTR